MDGFKPVKPKDPNRKPAAAFFLEDPKENEPDLIERIFVKLDQMDKRFDAFEKKMENRFDQLDDRLEKMEKSLINLQK